MFKFLSYFSFCLLTLVAVPDSVEVDIVRVASKKEEAEPWLERVDGHNEEDSDDPTLFGTICIAAKILINLLRKWAFNLNPLFLHKLNR